MRNPVYRLLVSFAVCAALALTACKPTAPVIIRGDQGHVIDESKKPGTTTRPSTPQIDFDADNDVTRTLLTEAYSWLNTPYLWGGITKDGADCSGFVMMVYRNALDINLPRTSYDQGAYTANVDRDDMQPGDLIFFRTTSPDRIGHVGMYVGNGQMIHASSSKGVTISNISDNYWVTHYDHCGKVNAYRRQVSDAQKAERAKAKEQRRANKSQQTTKPSQPTKSAQQQPTKPAQQQAQPTQQQPTKPAQQQAQPAQQQQTQPAQQQQTQPAQQQQTQPAQQQQSQPAQQQPAQQQTAQPAQPQPSRPAQQQTQPAQQQQTQPAQPQQTAQPAQPQPTQPAQQQPTSDKDNGQTSPSKGSTRRPSRTKPETPVVKDVIIRRGGAP